MEKPTDKKRQIIVPELVCPSCSKQRILQPVSIPKGKNNIHGFGSVYRCYHCGEETYFKTSIQKQIKKLERKLLRRSNKKRR